jgi:hypothetical protein
MAFLITQFVLSFEYLRFAIHPQDLGGLIIGGYPKGTSGPFLTIVAVTDDLK